jgi:hypothetical protein
MVPVKNTRIDNMFMVNRPVDNGKDNVDQTIHAMIHTMEKPYRQSSDHKFKNNQDRVHKAVLSNLFGTTGRKSKILEAEGRKSKLKSSG